MCLQLCIPKTVLCAIISVCCVCLKTWNCWRSNWIIEAASDRDRGVLFIYYFPNDLFRRLGCVYVQQIYTHLVGTIFVRHRKLHNLAWTRNKIQSGITLRHLLMLNWCQNKTHKHLSWTYDTQISLFLVVFGFTLMSHLFLSIFLHCSHPLGAN